jgi:ribosome-interacting GTPase 1
MAKQTLGMNAEVARLVCKEYRISCAEIIIRENITVDQVSYYRCLME